jgi:hypothetical protein
VRLDAEPGDGRQAKPHRARRRLNEEVGALVDGEVIRGQSFQHA